MNEQEVTKKGTKKSTKKKMVTSLCLVLIAVLLIGGTLAYLSDEEEVTNRFTLGDVDVDIDEGGWKKDPKPFPEPKEGEEDDPIDAQKSWDISSDFGDGDAVKAGDEITYKIEYYNHHNTSQTVTIVDELDNNVEYISSSPAGTYDSNEHKVKWEINTAAYTVGKVTVTVQVKSSVSTGDKIKNGGTVQIGDDTKQDLEEIVNKVDDDRVINPGEGGNLTPGDTKIKDPLITAVKGDMYMRIEMTVNELNAAGEKGDIITDQEQLELILDTLYKDPGYPDNPTLDTDESYSSATLTSMIGSKIYDLDHLPEFKLDNTYSTAGKYYYNYTVNDGILTEGESVYFITHVVVPSDWGEDELIVLGDYAVTFKVQAVQADSFSSMSEAMAALHAEVSQ